MNAKRLSLFGAIAITVLALGYAHLPKIWVAREERIARPHGYEFTGALPTYADDCFSYWSWMRQAREGSFFFEDLYTTEPHPRNYVNVLFWSFGTVARVADVSEHRVYSVARLLLSLGLCFALWKLAGRLFPAPFIRLTAFGFFVVQGGWSGVADVFERHWQTPHVTSPEWWTPEMSTAFSMMLFPHFIAGFLCMVGIALLALGAWQAPTDRAARTRAAAAGLVMTLLTFFHPYDVVPMIAAVWLGAGAVGATERRFPRRELETAGIATAVWVPALVYNAWIFMKNPAMRAWDLQNVMTTPEPSRLVIGLGMGGALAILALVRLGAMSRPLLFTAAWFVAHLALIHLPLRFQRRMIGGIQFPTAALATLALAVWFAPPLARALSRRPAWVRWRQAFGAAPVGVTVFAIACAVFPLTAAGPKRIVELEWAELRRVRYPAWVRDTEVAALEALDRIKAPGVTVVSSYEMGGLVPPWSGHRTYLGHYALTVDAQRKRAEIARFFSTDEGDDTFRLDMLRRAGATHVLYGAHERALGGFDPATRTWLHEVFRAGGGDGTVVLYEVDRMAREGMAGATPVP